MLAPPQKRPAAAPARDARLARALTPVPAHTLAAMLNGRASAGLAPDRAANRTGLPEALKSGLEALSGLAMDDVRVHYASSRPAQLQAHAFAQGTDIHLAPRQDHHLPHEAWHVFHQKQGWVRPTLSLGDAAVNDDRRAIRDETDLIRNRDDLLIDRDDDTRSEAGRYERNGYRYRINVNPRSPISAEHPAPQGQERNLASAAEIHELTHIAVFEGYGGRNANSKDPFNLIEHTEGEPSEAERDEVRRLYALAEGLERTRSSDPVLRRLPKDQRDFIAKRVEYIQQNPLAELDTVINELAYYLHASRVPADSPFSREVVRIARQRRQLRNPDL